MNGKKALFAVTYIRELLMIFIELEVRVPKLLQASFLKLLITSAITHPYAKTEKVYKYQNILR
jgi:hypothetical protein